MIKTDPLHTVEASNDMSSKNIRIVLVNTKHPGNIGSAARAMKTMGLSSLYLVNPVQFPSPASQMMAAGADDILEKAIVVNTLEDAIADCTFIAGASARIRGISLPVKTPSECAEQLLEESGQHEVAMVFGREDRGLTNAELCLCHQHVHIPSVDDFSSLNLAASVQVLAYEIRKQQLSLAKTNAFRKPSAHPLADTAEMEYFYEHLEHLLHKIDFFEHSSAEKIMTKLRRLYGKARPDQVEIAILRGILTETQKQLDKSESR